MSQPANDEFSQHLSDDEASNHEDASNTIFKRLKMNGTAKYILLMVIPKLEAHGAEVSTEDANHKFLRSLPLVWSNLAMTMRTKPDVDTLSIDDMYNNLRVFEQEIQSASKTFSSAQNVAFVSQSKSSTNKVKSGFTGAYSTCTPSTSSTNIPEKEALAGFADEIDDLDIEEMDINWQIAMIAIRMKKFYKKTGRRVRVDGKAPVGFDKKKLECFNCHNTGHFARECTSKGTHDGKKKRDSFYQHQEARKQEKNQMGFLTMDDGMFNWGEHTEDEETNHALMAISSSSEVSLCSKTCIDSYNTLKTLCDEQMNQLGDQEAQILAYSQAVKKLEAQLVTFQKQRIGMKAVKEKEQLQKTLDSWKDSSKNLWRLINSGMSSSSKIGLGKRIVGRKPLYSRFTKTNDFKGVPHPLSGDYTPKPQKEIDESLYVYGKKGPQKPEPRSIGTSSEHSVDLEIMRISRVPQEEVAKPVWSNANRVNHACRPNINSVRSNINTGRPNVNSVRPNVNTVRTNINSVRQNVNSVWLNVNTGSFNVNSIRPKQPVPTSNSPNFSFERPQVNKFNQRSNFSKSHSSVRRPFAKNTAQMSHSHAVKGNWGSAVKTSAGYNWRPTRPNSNCNGGPTLIRTDHPLKNMEDRGIFDSGCSGHMTGNKDHLDDFEECKGGSITFGGSKGYITGKELGHFNIFSISQICDKQHKVLFTETECLVVTPDFKMPDENQILLKVPRQHNMYSFDMKTPGPAKSFACLIAKATSDESKLWHRMLGKQHRASCKAKLERMITEPLHTLHMDLFGPTFVKSINHASYCLVITDDCTRFSWVFFLATKDETSGILQNFIRQIKNQLNHRVKIIRSDNGTEFKNRDMLEFCRNKGIKQEYSNARTPQQNGVAKRMNKTLIEAARTILADSLLPTTFWAEAVSTACYIFNRVRVTKPQNKTPYELLFGQKPIISYIRPFGCHVTILDTLSVLGKFDGKCDESFLVEKPNVKGVGYRWMFDIDYLTDSMNYIPMSLENQTNQHAGTLQTPNANASEEEDEAEDLIVVPTSVKHTTIKVGPRKSSTISKAEKFVKELQNPKTQEKEAYSTGISEDTPEILAFQRELDDLAQKHLREVPKNKATSTNSVNFGIGQDHTQNADQDDSDMPELTIFNKP
ncbi:putative ribonuclease H-like domain-containing protein [Tanacetum coccineum]